MAPRAEPLTPAESARSFQVPEDLEFEQVLAEPIVRQPVFLNFDERGRMWVVQYLQYPAPAGLNVVSRDLFWRAVYDKVPLPPPRGVRGLDKITIRRFLHDRPAPMTSCPIRAILPPRPPTEAAIRRRIHP